MQLRQHREQVRGGRIPLGAEHPDQALFRRTRATAQLGIADRAFDDIAQQVARDGELVVEQGLNGLLEQSIGHCRFTMHARFDDLID